MDMGRVKQIVDSPKEIEVHYQGEPVWIQVVHEMMRRQEFIQGMNQRMRK